MIHHDPHAFQLFSLWSIRASSHDSWLRLSGKVYLCQDEVRGPQHLAIRPGDPGMGDLMRWNGWWLWIDIYILNIIHIIWTYMNYRKFELINLLILINMY